MRYPILSALLCLVLAGVAPADETPWPATPVPTPAAKPFAVACTTSNAMLKIWVEGKQLHFHLEDGVGFDDFPLYSGTVTKPMVPLIERAVKELSAFDGVVDTSWPVTNCQFDAARPMLVVCHGSMPFAAPENAGLNATSLSTELDQQQTLEVQAQTVSVNLGLSTTGADFAHYFLSFPFDADHCSAQ